MSARLWPHCLQTSRTASIRQQRDACDIYEAPQQARLRITPPGLGSTDPFACLTAIRHTSMIVSRVTTSTQGKSAEWRAERLCVHTHSQTRQSRHTLRARPGAPEAHAGAEESAGCAGRRGRTGGLRAAPASAVAAMKASAGGTMTCARAACSSAPVFCTPRGQLHILALSDTVERSMVLHGIMWQVLC